jgi:histone H3/H4
VVYLGFKNKIMILKRETFDKFLKKFGAKRVSPEAAEYLAKYVEEKTILLLKEAKVCAEHAKRNTVLQDDIRLARKNLNL